MKKILAVVGQVFRRNEAATMVEYALVLLLVALVCIATVSFIGSNEVLPMFRTIIPAL